MSIPFTELLMERARFPDFPTVLLVILLPLSSPGLTLSAENRPHWTHKSSFILGDDLYAIGVASHAPTIEEGRQKAFDHGVVEIMNFGQTAHLSNLVIETQMTFEMVNPDHSFTVYRLLKVSVKKLLKSKKKEFENDWESPRMREAIKRLRALRQAQSPRKSQLIPY